MAAIGGGFYQTRYLWLFAAAASLIFWLVEAVWKSFQYLYSPRIQQLEKALASGEFAGIAPFQVYASWFASLQEQGFGIFENLSPPNCGFPSSHHTCHGRDFIRAACVRFGRSFSKGSATEVIHDRDCCRDKRTGLHE